MLKLLFSLIGGAPFKLYGALGAIIVIASIVGAHLFADSRVRNQRDEAIKQFEKYRDVQKELADTQRLQIELAKLEGKKQAEMIDAQRKLALEKLGLAMLDRERLKNEMRQLNENLAHSQTRLADTKHNYDERLRVEAVNRAAGLREEPAAAEGLAGGGGECDRTLATLTSACQMTTIDFNTCRAALDNDTATVGRDP